MHVFLGLPSCDCSCLVSAAMTEGRSHDAVELSSRTLARVVLRRPENIEPFSPVKLRCHHNLQQFSYRKHIARQLRTLYIEGININVVTLKCGSEITQCHLNWYRSKAWMLCPICLS